MSSSDDRVIRRADDRPAEEIEAGSADPAAQAEAILAESDERQDGSEGRAGWVEHRTVDGRDLPSRD
ncbi:MAG: hypothetical protein KGQ66_16515 [Acidobacteriota bacterium]|nr:hypothetical protein [Acidobacteriota bacterium]